MSASISSLSASDLEASLEEFAGLLHACVHAGANVNFVLPFPLAEASAFWRERVLPPLGQGRRLLLAAREEGRLLGTVQLDHDTPPNQPHRAEVAKLLVHPAARRRGIARALMGELEGRARGLGRSLLTLDTRTGDAAEPLYLSLGYERAGIIPDFCLDPLVPRLYPTTIMFRRL